MLLGEVYNLKLLFNRGFLLRFLSTQCLLDFFRLLEGDFHLLSLLGLHFFHFSVYFTIKRNIHRLYNFYFRLCIRIFLLELLFQLFLRFLNLLFLFYGFHLHKGSFIKGTVRKSRSHGQIPFLCAKRRSVQVFRLLFFLFPLFGKLSLLFFAKFFLGILGFFFYRIFFLLFGFYTLLLAFGGRNLGLILLRLL